MKEGAEEKSKDEEDVNEKEVKNWYWLWEILRCYGKKRDAKSESRQKSRYTLLFRDTLQKFIGLC